jgi:MFS family permease
MGGDNPHRSADKQGLARVVDEQLREAERFWFDRNLRTAMIVPWAESFTSAFQGPVYPFFMQELGLDAGQMGQLRSITLSLQAAGAPIAGWLLDTHGPFLGIALPSSLCAIGCAAKATAAGMSGLFVGSVFSGLSGAKSDMAMAHVSRHTAVLRRTLALSAGRVQLQALYLLGCLCFTPVNVLLTKLLPENVFGMLRFRLEIAVCSVGCGFGGAQLTPHATLAPRSTHTCPLSSANARGSFAPREIFQCPAGCSLRCEV